MQISDYLNLITSEHKDKQKFIATVSVNVQIQVAIQAILTSLVDALDIDLALGSQLDVLGEIVGVSRVITVSIANTLFTWNGVDATGWNYGVWQDQFAPLGTLSLPDDVYRTLIKTKIAANAWDGTTEGAYAIWAQLFSTQQILIQDNQDMTMGVVLIGGSIDSLTLGLLTGGYISLRPEGVQTIFYAVPADTNPGFGWNVSSAYLGGWGTGSWLNIVSGS
jgi:hypothetical protein